MPLAVALIVRSVVVMTVQLGLIEAGMWLLDRAIKQTALAFGATEEQATDIVANSYLQFAEAVGIGAVTLRAKLPAKVAERLGFTSKGFKPRPSKLGERPVNIAAAAAAKPTAAQAAATIAETATAIAAKGRTTFETVQGVAQMLIAVLGIPIGIGLVVTNTIDFGAWSSSAYQEAFQKIFRIFGLEPDRDYVKAKVLSEDMSKKIFATYAEVGATGIKDPRTGKTLPFSRENVIGIADFLAAQVIAESGSVTTRQMIGLLTALVVRPGRVAGAATAPLSVASAASPTLSDVRVFTGLVAQGTLGGSPTFVARPDDLIESAAELRDAAQNNIAAYLAALPGRIVYEIKIAPSVTTRDGFRQTGESREIVTGYSASGEPRVKRVTNKFATVTFYALTDRGAKSKLATITIGPTDAIGLRLAPGDLAAIEQNIRQSVAVTDVSAIRAVEGAGALNFAAVQGVAIDGQADGGGALAALPQPPDGFEYATGPGLPRGFLAPVGAPIYTGSVSRGMETTQNFIYQGKQYSFVFGGAGDTLEGISSEQIRADLQARSPGENITQDAIEGERLRRAFDIRWRRAVTSAENVALAPTQSATTLSQYYTALGTALPSIAARAKIYEELRLGQAAYYVGTAEQNARLLDALKSAALSPSG